MSSYIIAIGGDTPITEILESGHYVYKSFDNKGKVRIVNPDNLDYKYQIPILSDFASMRPGDYVYFLKKRMVYGRGIITDVRLNTTNESIGYFKFKNDTTIPFIKSGTPEGELQGIDMDELLQYRPNEIKATRMFFNLSCIKINPLESSAIKEAIHSRRIKLQQSQVLQINSPEVPEQQDDKIKKLISKHFKRRPILKKNEIEHESALELYIVHKLASNEDLPEFLKSTTHSSRRWDFIHRQVPASPVKATKYIDRIDILCMSFIDDEKRVCSEICVIEIKNEKAKKDDIYQLMKYVDWCASEYTKGRYDLIRCALMAPEFEEIDLSEDTLKRTYLQEYKPAKFSLWERGIAKIKINILNDGKEFSNITFSEEVTE